MRIKATSFNEEEETLNICIAEDWDEKWPDHVHVIVCIVLYVLCVILDIDLDYIIIHFFLFYI